MIPRSAIRHAVDVDRLIDRLVAAGEPLDAHPIQVDGDEIRRLEAELDHLTYRWLQSRGVEVR